MEICPAGYGRGDSLHFQVAVAVESMDMVAASAVRDHFSLETLGIHWHGAQKEKLSRCEWAQLKICFAWRFWGWLDSFGTSGRSHNRTFVFQYGRGSIFQADVQSQVLGVGPVSFWCPITKTCRYVVALQEPCNSFDM